MARVLTKSEIDEIKKGMVQTNETKPVRFLADGCNFNICTGETMRKGTNVLYQMVYWNFSRTTANRIADLTGTTAVFSD